MADYKLDDQCEKQLLIENDAVVNPPTRQPPTLRERIIRHVFPCILLLLSASILLRKVVHCHPRHVRDPRVTALQQNPFMLAEKNISKVALEAHIMSKCPDAKACLEQLVVPAMAEVSDLVNFTLSYIGTIDDQSDEVHCMHGPSECLGNIIQLCAAYEYPSPIIYLGFANCMTSDYKNIPDRDLIEGCALEHGIDFHKLNDCISNESLGFELLKKSVQHSMDVNVTTSCTIRLEGKVRCVRDGGKWKNCPGGPGVLDLVGDIELLYLEKNLLGDEF